MRIGWCLWVVWWCELVFGDLTGTYYEASFLDPPPLHTLSPHFTGQDLTTTELPFAFGSNLYYEYFTKPWYPEVRTTDFGVRWEGQIVAAVPGNYSIYVFSDDGVRIWVDGTVVVEAYFLQYVNDSAPLISDPFFLDNTSYHKLEIEFYQHFLDSYISLHTSNYTLCCSFPNGLTYSVYNLNMEQLESSFTRIDPFLNFTGDDDSFHWTYYAIWTGTLITPEEFTGQHVTFYSSLFSKLTLDGMVIFDTLESKQGESIGSVVLEGRYNLTLEVYHQFEYTFTILNWGIGNDLTFLPESATSPFVPSHLTVDDKSIIVLDQDLTVQNITVGENSILIVNGDVSFSSTFLSGQLKINGNIRMIENHILISVSHVNQTVPAMQVSECLMSYSPTSTVTISLHTPLSSFNTPYTLLQLNCTDLPPSAINYVLPPETPQSTWGCDGHNTYHASYQDKTLLVFKSYTPGCGFGFIVVVAVGSSILFIALLIGLGVCIKTHRRHSRLTSFLRSKFEK